MIARRKYGWIGIDFGEGATEIAQLERAGERLRWRRIAIPSQNRDGRLPWSGDELRHALEVDGGFHGRVAACILPASSTELRTISVPPGSDAERRAMIAQELEAAAGGTYEPREFDFWRLGGPAGEQEGVQVLSAASETVAELTELLASAGLECAVLDGLPCALARASTMAPDGVAEGPQAAIDWGYANATVTIVEGGRAQFTRVLRDCGAASLFAEVEQALGLDAADAVELLGQFGLHGAQQDDLETAEIREAVSDIASPHLERLIDELMRTFGFLRLQRQALVPKRAWLFGGGATVKNVAGFLSARLAMPCETWRLAAADEQSMPAPGEAMFGPVAALSALGWRR